MYSLQIATMLLALFKFMFFLEAFEKYSFLTQLFTTTIELALPFFLLLAIFLITFGTMYYIAGVDFDLDSTYDDMPIIIAYYLQTFENSIGNIGAPELHDW